MVTHSAAVAGAQSDYSIWRVILASAVGTMIEWYDFYIFGSLAVYLSPKFYPAGNNTLALIAYLSHLLWDSLYAPLELYFFGRIGDIVGRKYAFIVTLTIMGGATALIGLLPTYQTAGWFAPVALLLIRVVQRPCPWWRIWRCCSLCSGTCPGRKTRLLHQLHTDHRLARFLYFDSGRARHASIHE